MLILSNFMTDQRCSVINMAYATERPSHTTGVIVFEAPIHDIEMMATEDQVIDLIRCGVRYNGEYGALVMDI